jgi:hypothetical protein
VFRGENNVRIHALLIWAGLSLMPLRIAEAQSAGVPGAGHGYFLVAAQDLYIRYHTDSHGTKAKPGTVMNRIALLGLDYGITDQLALYAELPYKSNVYHGVPHKHIDAHGEKFIDDGTYHNGWGDWAVGLRYQWIFDSWLVTPYATLGTPTRDYPTYAHAAVGTGQDSLIVGVNTDRPLPIQNLFFEGGLGYAFMEVVDHRRVNHATLTAGLNYLATPLLTLHGFVTFNKTFNGLDFPDDYPPGVDQETFFHHDQNLRNDFINFGAGLSYQFSDRYSLLVDVGHTLWGENTHLARFVWTLGITRSF